MKYWIYYIILILAIGIYSSVGMFTRFAAEYAFFSWQYILWVLCAMIVLGVYAVIWQQILCKMNVGVAYVFRGLAILFSLLISHFVFAESITVNNMIGAVFIMSGIVMFAWLDNKERLLDN